MGLNPSDVLRLAEAIGRKEGVYQHGTVPARLNNPGDLLFAGQEGAVGVPVKGKDGKWRVFAEFSSLSKGWTGLVRQLAKFAQQGWNVRKAIETWAPPSDGNDTPQYLEDVCKWAEVLPETLLEDLFVPIPSVPFVAKRPVFKTN